MANSRILSNVEKNFMVNALDLGLRVDGRQLDTIREMKIDFGDKTGTIEVSLGKTRCLVRVTHDLGPPILSKPNQGIIKINCTFPKYYNQITQNEIDRICLIIKSGIYESKAIDLESLCILTGTKVWTITCNISVIQHDGNIIDCANLAVLCGLKHHRRPDVTVVGSKITVHSMADKHPMALSIHHLPICVTLAHVLCKAKDKKNKKYEDGFYTFNDPCLQEEKLMNGRTIYCMTKHRQLCAIDKIGGVPMSAKSFLGFIEDFVMDVVKKWSNQIDNKFIKYTYQSNDALSRKNKLFKQEVDAIDVFGFGELKEKVVEVDDKEMKVDGGDDGVVGDEDVDYDKIWNDWENKEKVKLELMRNNLNEKRVAQNKSVLTSEFE